MLLEVGVDFDGTIVKFKGGPPPFEEMPGAIEAIKKIADLGVYVYIWSCRTNASQNVTYKAAQEMFDWLIEMKLLPHKNIEVWQRKEKVAKPEFDFFVDDRSIPPFAGDWDAVVACIEKKLLQKG